MALLPHASLPCGRSLKSLNVGSLKKQIYIYIYPTPAFFSFGSERRSYASLSNMQISSPRFSGLPRFSPTAENPQLKSIIASDVRMANLHLVMVSLLDLILKIFQSPASTQSGTTLFQGDGQVSKLKGSKKPCIFVPQPYVGL